MHQIGDNLESDPEKELTPIEIGEFFKNFYTLTIQVREMSTQLEEIREKF